MAQRLDPKYAFTKIYFYHQCHTEYIFSVSHPPKYILSVEWGQNIIFMSGPWVLGRNVFFHWNGFEIYFDWEYFLGLIRVSGALVPGEKNVIFLPLWDSWQFFIVYRCFPGAVDTCYLQYWALFLWSRAFFQI